MTHDTDHFGVNQFLGNRRADFRIGLIVFFQEFKFNLGATDGDAFCIGFVNRQLGTVFIVLAKVSDAAGQRTHVTELDDHFSGLCGCSRRRSNRLFFFATTDQGDGSGDNEGDTREASKAHLFSP